MSGPDSIDQRTPRALETELMDALGLSIKLADMLPPITELADRLEAKLADALKLLEAGRHLEDL
jgi:hypothetical protein